MRIEANTYRVFNHIIPSLHFPINEDGTCGYFTGDIRNYTATHGRVSAIAPTMHEAVALCLNGVYQVKFIKN